MKKKILINGYFLCRKITGIERYALEITSRLDKLCFPGEISLIVPGDCSSVPNYKNITIIRYRKKIPHIFWQMLSLQMFLLLNPGYMILDFGNTCLPFFPGIIFLHDIYCKLFFKDFNGFRDKIVCLYNRWQYSLITRKARKIVTVSNFIKNHVINTYKVNPERISVIYSSWNHFMNITPDYSIYDDFPVLSKSFYFSLGSLSKRKNITWIIEYAKKNPDMLFALSGESLPTVKEKKIGNVSDLENIILLGYLNDSKVKALMEKCKAFLLPSYYEGFGLTPLEALSCGAKIIISNTASLPEIYCNTAHYIDPYNTDIDLDDLLKQPVDNPDEILKKYSYDTSAEQVYKIIKEVS